MTTSLSAALRMHRASVFPAPVPGASAEPRSPMAATRANGSFAGKTGGTITPAIGGRLGGSDGSGRFGGIMRPSVGGGWDREDQAQLAGGGPLRR